MPKVYDTHEYSLKLFQLADEVQLHIVDNRGKIIEGGLLLAIDKLGRLYRMSLVSETLAEKANIQLDEQGRILFYTSP